MNTTVKWVVARFQLFNEQCQLYNYALQHVLSLLKQIRNLNRRTLPADCLDIICYTIRGYLYVYLQGYPRCVMGSTPYDLNSLKYFALLNFLKYLKRAYIFLLLLLNNP